MVSLHSLGSKVKYENAGERLGMRLGLQNIPSLSSTHWSSGSLNLNRQPVREPSCVQLWNSGDMAAVTSFPFLSPPYVSGCKGQCYSHTLLDTLFNWPELTKMIAYLQIDVSIVSIRSDDVIVISVVLTSTTSVFIPRMAAAHTNIDCGGICLKKEWKSASEYVCV